MLTIVCFLWRDPSYRYGLRYSHEHVNRLRNMVARHLAQPHRFVCVTDQPDGIEAGIEIIPLWPDYRGMGGTWTRVKLFSTAMRDILGERFVLMDLDCVVTGPLDPLFETDDEFVTTRSSNPASIYNTGFFLLRAGSRPQVFERFTPEQALAAISVDGMWEQGWVSLVLGGGEQTWGPEHGVYEYGRHVARGNGGKLPDGARVVFFSGPHDPSLAACRAKSPWIAEHWQ